MGSVFSHIPLTLRTFCAVSASYKALWKRLLLSPGIPVSNPSVPYWSVPPSPIARHGSEGDTLPLTYADVVIIGSGITGTAFARTLLDHDAQHREKGRPVNVVMLEARDACSGATARNGGHITPPIYHDYSELKEAHGAPAAQKIIRFRLAHLSELLAVASEENLLQDSQCRKVQTFDVYFDQGLFASANKKLALFKMDMPAESESYKVYEGSECVKKLQLSPRAAGCLSTLGGALHPYRLVAGVLSRLLRAYPDNFHLLTHTPCTAISAPTSSAGLYTLSTPRGSLQTPHIIHATNAWASHLLPLMRGKIVPVRGNMSAQRPGAGLGQFPTSPESGVGICPPVHSDPRGSEESWLGTRSFVFYPGPSPSALDYLTQQLQVPPTSSSNSIDDHSPAQTSSPSMDTLLSLDISPGPKSSYPTPAAELMFGGGFLQGGHAERAFFEEAGNVDDSGWNLGVGTHLSGALGVYFSGWGQEGRDRNSSGEDPWGKGRVKALWSGILGISADGMPWVGRVPEKVSGRATPQSSVHHPPTQVRDFSSPRSTAMSPPGEWISAGYSGEGMVHAWMSGKALAHMVLGLDSDHDGGAETDEFPDVFRVSEKRWKSATVERLLDSFVS